MVHVRVPLPNRLKSFHSSTNVHNNGTPPASEVPSRSSSPKPAMHDSRLNTLILRVNVIKARNLAAKDKSGTSDPYLVLVLGDDRHSTICIPKTLNPEWNELIELPIVGVQSGLLEVVCWDKDRFKKDYMGEFEVALDEVFADGNTSQKPKWYGLESKKTGRKKSVVTGEVMLEISICDPANPSATTQSIFQKLSALSIATPLISDESSPLSYFRSANGGLEDEDTDSGLSEGSDHETETDDPTKAETPEKRKRRLRLRRLKKRAKQGAYAFSQTSDLDGVLFLEIQRITDLPPERNMTKTSFDMDPFVVSSLGKKTYKTRVIRHNLNPVYDEKLVFHVLRHESKYTLHFTVIDRDKLSGNDFIGTAEFPIENATLIAAEADVETGLYPLKIPESYNGLETKKSRFKIPLSRTTSSTSVHKVPSRPRLTDYNSQLSLSGNVQLDQSLQPLSSTQTASVTPTLTSQSSSGNATSSTNASQEPPSMSNLNIQEDGHDDPDLKAFALPISLKKKEKWEDKHKPTIFIRAKYVPYRALRQQFWRAMLRAYDADDSGSLSKVELTTMLDTLGSTLHESTIDGFFKRFNASEPNGEQTLTFDQAVMCLEDWLQTMEKPSRHWFQKDQSKDHTITSNPSSRSVDTTQHSTDSIDRSDYGLGIKTSPESTEPSTPIKASSQTSEIIVTKASFHSSQGDDGENDLADERGEERMVEIRECPICHQPRLTKKSDSDIITHIATCASQDWRQVNNIVMAGFVTSSQAQRKWYTKVITKIGYGGYRLGANSANILVQDRITGQINEERMSVYVRLGIRLLYKGLKSKDMEKKRIRKLLRSLSFKQGRKYDDPASKDDIQGFINFHQLDMTEVLLQTEQFKTFNEFFYRKLKPDARPCSAPDIPQIITSPADCRSVVFNQIDDAQKIWVKGREFSIARLLGNAYPEDAKRYSGGALGIFRLAPQDYHRFHIPVDGILAEPKLIEGDYFTVNPMAIRSTLDVYGENIRVVVPIDSVAHGRVMVICVGAMMVGSTVITRKAGEKVARAEELGYFKFGGSTLILLFEPRTMLFDSDLTDNSATALETLIRVGMSIGHSPDQAPHLPDMPKDPANVTYEEQMDARRRIEGSIAPTDGRLPPIGTRIK